MINTSNPTRPAWSRVTLATALLAVLSTGSAAQTDGRSALKVCADPNYAPFSTEDQKGFENEIAQLIAKDLSLPLEYTWFPQRMGFIRNTLKSTDDDGATYKCDLVMGVPSRFDMAITTKPYYRSTYALVYVEGSALDGVASGQDFLALDAGKRAGLSIGMTERSPGTLWLAKHNMYELIEGYTAQSGDPKEFPGEPILRDLQSGKIDAAIIWGPTAGLFSEQTANGKKIISVPLESEPGVRFDFAISAAVRHGEKDWRDQIGSLLEKHKPDITKILQAHHVPMLEMTESPTKTSDD